MISTPFDYSRATSLDDALAKLAAAAARQADRRRPQPGAADEAAAQRAEDAHRHRADPRPVGHSREGRRRSRSAPARCITTSPRRRCCGSVCPVLADAAASIGDPQVRNRGTHRRQPGARRPGGRLPGGDARARRRDQLKSARGSRVVKADDFFQGLFTVDLAPDEIIAGVQFAPVKRGGLRQAPPARVALRDRRRRRGARGEGRRDSVGAHRPDRRDVARDAADAMSRRRSTGKTASAASIEAASRHAGAKLEDVNSDIHASEEYRRAMVPVFTERALKGALARD